MGPRERYLRQMGADTRRELLLECIDIRLNTQKTSLTTDLRLSDDFDVQDLKVERDEHGCHIALTAISKSDQVSQITIPLSDVQVGILVERHIHIERKMGC